MPCWYARAHDSVMVLDGYTSQCKRANRCPRPEIAVSLLHTFPERYLDVAESCIELKERDGAVVPATRYICSG